MAFISATKLLGTISFTVALFAGCSSQNDEVIPSPQPSDTNQSDENAPAPTPTAPGDSEDDETPTSSPSKSSPSSSETDTSDPDEPAAIPDDPVDYADALIIAWGNGDEDQMRQFANDEVVDTLTDYGQAGGPHWDQTEHDAGAGSVFVTYTNTENDDTVELRIENEAAAAGEEQAVVEAKFNQ